MKTHKPGTVKNTKRLALYRAVVWTLLVLIVTSGLGNLAHADTYIPGPSVGESAAADATVRAAEAQGAAFTDPDLNAFYSSNPHKLLPEARWEVGLTTDLGSRDIPKSLGTTLAGFAFQIAAMVWRVVFLLMDVSTRSDLIANFGLLMDRGYAQITGGVAGLIAVVWGVTMWRMGVLTLKGRGTTAMRKLVAFVAPVALLLYMGQQAKTSVAANSLVVSATGGNADSGYSPTYVPTQGAPSWFASELSEYINTAAGEVTGVVTGANFLAGSDASKLGEAISYGDAYDCSDYIDGLYAQYRYYMEQTTGRSSGGSNAIVMQAFSRLWLASFYDSWSSAQFGDTSARHLVACRILEERNLITPQEQGQIEAVAPGSPGAANEKVYALQADEKAEKDDVAGWQRCVWAGGSWTSLGWDGKLPDCEKRWAEGDVNAMKGDAPTDGANYSNNEVERLNRSFNGHNAGERVAQGAVSLAVAGVYAWVFVGISFGNLIAQLGLLIGVVFAGISLLALSAGSQVGGKALRLTVGFIGSKALFAVLLSVLAKLTTLGTVLFHAGGVGTSAHGGTLSAGFGGAVMAGITPLMALLIVSRATGALGLGKLTSLKGSASMLANMAGKATNSRDMSSFLTRGSAGGKGGGMIARSKKGLVDSALRSQRNRQSVRQLDRVAKAKTAAEIRHREQIAKAERAAADKAAEGGKASLVSRVRQRTTEAKERAKEKIEQLRGQRGVGGGRWNRHGENKQRGLIGQHVAGQLPVAAPRSLPDLSAGRLPDVTRSDREVGFGAPLLNGDPAVQRELLEQRRRETLQAEMVSGGDVAGSLAKGRMLDELRAGGNLITGVDGELSAGERTRAGEKAAAALNVDPRHVITDRFGNSVVDASTWPSRHLIPPSLRHLPELCLPDSVVAPMDNESDAARAERITATLIDSGHRWISDGNVVVSDMYAQRNLGDPGTLTNRENYEAYWTGTATSTAGVPVIDPPENLRVGAVASLVGTDVRSVEGAADLWTSAQTASTHSLAALDVSQADIGAALKGATAKLQRATLGDASASDTMDALANLSELMGVVTADAAALYAGRNEVSGVMIDTDEIVERLNEQLSTAWSEVDVDAPTLPTLRAVLNAINDTNSVIANIRSEVSDLPDIYGRFAEQAKTLAAGVLAGRSPQAPQLNPAPIDPRGGIS